MIKRHKADGITAFILDWKERRLSGYSYDVHDGDEISVKLKNGRTALLVVRNIKRSHATRDQYFADLIDMGFEEDFPLKEQK